MSRSWMIAVGTMALVLAGSSAVKASERTEDPLGDAVGDAPDIVAVAFGQPEDQPRVSVSIEFAEDPPLETDQETYSDVVFIHLDVDPETVNTIQFDTDDEYDYIIGTHAVQLPFFVESGGMLYETAGLSEVHENVVDVAVEGTTITWTVDRALIGDPDAISWAVLAAVEMDDAEEMAFDASPNEGEPWGLYVITPEAVAATEQTARPYAIGVFQLTGEDRYRGLSMDIFLPPDGPPWGRTYPSDDLMPLPAPPTGSPHPTRSAGPIGTWPQRRSEGC